jgi:hypothetical protein
VRDVKIESSVWESAGWLLAPSLIERSIAQDALREAYRIFPSPADYFAAPEAYPALASSQFAGMTSFPFSGSALSLLCVDEPLLDLVATCLRTDRPLLYQAHLWAKYQGATEYDQTHHRDYAKNTMLAPVGPHVDDAVGVFVFLTDVEEQDGPTALVSRDATADLPLEPARHGRDTMPRLYEHETLATGPAGSVLIYGTDTFHRGTELRRHRGARISLKLAFKRPEATWVNYHAGLRIGFEPEWSAFVREASARQLEAVGFPPAHTVLHVDSRLQSSMELRYGVPLFRSDGGS